MNGSGPSFFSDTSNQCLLIWGKANLRKWDPCLEPILGFLWVPYLLIVSNCQHFKRLSWNVYHWCHKDTLLVEVFLTKSLARLLLDYEIVEVDVSIKAARSEAHVILPPVNASDLVYMPFALIVAWLLFSVEVVDIDGIKPNRTGK